jgi:2-furoate---CoA ligase
LHPAVAEVAVVGLSDERWGQRITAFVKRGGAIEADALDAWCRGSSLAGYKRPREYVFCRRNPEIAGRQDLAPPARRRRVSEGIA